VYKYTPLGSTQKFLMQFDTLPDCQASSTIRLNNFPNRLQRHSSKARVTRNPDGANVEPTRGAASRWITRYPGLLGYINTPDRDLISCNSERRNSSPLPKGSAAVMKTSLVMVAAFLAVFRA